MKRIDTLNQEEKNETLYNQEDEAEFEDFEEE